MLVNLEDIPVDGLEHVDVALTFGQKDTSSDCPKEEHNTVKNSSSGFHDCLYLTKEKVVLLSIWPGMALSALWPR